VVDKSQECNNSCCEKECDTSNQWLSSRGQINTELEIIHWLRFYIRLNVIPETNQYATAAATPAIPCPDENACTYLLPRPYQGYTVISEEKQSKYKKMTPLPDVIVIPIFCTTAQNAQSTVAKSKLTQKKASFHARLSIRPFCWL